jgi:hypothetical protein
VNLDPVALAEQAMAATRSTIRTAVEDMLTKPHHVLIYPEGQDELGHLAMEGLAHVMVTDLQESNPSLDNFVILDSPANDGWDRIAPTVDVMTSADLKPGYLHRSQSIIAFGPQFLRSKVVRPLMRSANRFYAAIPDGPEAEELIERVHPLRQVVIL